MPRTWRWVLLVLLLVSLLFSEAFAAQKKNTSPRKPARARNNKGSQSDTEYTRRRGACSTNSEVLQPCVNQEIDTENCIMKCVSGTCYHQTFPEPMEEGEVLFERSNKFKRCAKEEIKTAYRRGEIL